MSVNLNTEAVRSMTALDIEAGQLVYVRHLERAVTVRDVSYLDRGMTVRLYRVGKRGAELPIDLGASDLVYLLKQEAS